MHISVMLCLVLYVDISDTSLRLCDITIDHDTTDKFIWSSFPNGVCSAHYLIGDWIWFQLNMMHPLLLGVGFGDYQLMKT
jgi:hypothetical protein